MTQFELPGYEYYARVPELYRSSLRNIEPGTAAAYIKLLMPLLVEQLTEHGPLQTEALRYHVNLSNHLQLEVDDVSQILWEGRRDAVFEDFLVDRQLRVYCWRIPAKESENVAADTSRYAAVKDFETGYYELVNLLRLVREDPAHANSPIEYLRKLGVL